MKIYKTNVGFTAVQGSKAVVFTNSLRKIRKVQVHPSFVENGVLLTSKTLKKSVLFSILKQF